MHQNCIWCTKHWCSCCVHLLCAFRENLEVTWRHQNCKASSGISFFWDMCRRQCLQCIHLISPIYFLKSIFCIPQFQKKIVMWQKNFVGLRMTDHVKPLCTNELTLSSLRALMSWPCQASVHQWADLVKPQCTNELTLSSLGAPMSWPCQASMH